MPEAIIVLPETTLMLPNKEDGRSASAPVALRGRIF